MINISTSKNLNIILPNTNKALAQVLGSATTQELELLTQGKDLKSVMGDILKQSANNPASDKVLLNLVKNNPTLKNLGNITDTIKDLLSSLKSNETAKEVLPIEKALKTFLTDIKDIKHNDLKQKLENSGVFLESRLKDVKNPLAELKATLDTLLKNLQTSTDPSTKTLSKEIQTLLNSETLKATPASVLAKESPKTLIQLASNVQSLIENIKSAIKGADSIHNPALDKAMTKIEQQLQTLSAENFKLAPIKESLEQISLYVNKSLTMESKSLIGALEKIFSTLKGIEQTQTTPKLSLEQFLNKNMPQSITKLFDNINALIQKSDPIFQKDAALLLNKLENLNSVQNLNPQAQVKEILSNDLKALLLQAGDDIAKASLPNQSDLLKNIDKLSLQIDNYQLLSHLSNGSSLYLPFYWDMLEEGNIQMKKDDDEKFYCDIDLKLKEYGELNLKLTLYEKNQLNLHIYSSNEEFKDIIRENIPTLRSSLIDVNVTPREIRIFEPKKTLKSPYESESDNFKMGFEVKA